MRPIRWPGIAAAVLAIGSGAACAAPAPPPTPIPSAAVASAAPPAPSEVSASGSPSAASASARPDLGATLDVRAIDPELTRRIDVFASTGSAIVFAAGFEPDVAADVAPDLWRLTPGPDARPELVWRNPDRDHGLTSIAGDLDTVAFVSLPLDGTRAWDLWVAPRDGEAVLLDSHPGDEEVPALVPSVAVYEPSVVWTAHDRGPSGPVSQLLVASAPDWTPRVLEERLAAEAELWLPSLRGDRLAYTEVVYAADRLSDERRVFLSSIAPDRGPPQRLDGSGRATMPFVTDGAVLWKEAEPGMNMFNWGEMFRYDLELGTVDRLPTGSQAWVNYPSAGERFVAWWGASPTSFGVYDLARGEARAIERYDPQGDEQVLRPHVSGGLIAWLFVRGDPGGGDAFAELRYATLPNVRELDR